MEKKQERALVESAMGDNYKNLEIVSAEVFLGRWGKTGMLLFKEKMGYDFKCQREMDFVVSLCKEHYVSHQTMFGAKGIDN